MNTQKERNQRIVIKAFRHLILTGDAVTRTYHIPGEDGKDGYDVTIYKVKPIIQATSPKGRRRTR